MKEQGYVKGHDRHRLYYNAFIPNKIKAVLVVVHGVNEHAERYQNLIHFFQNNYAIYLYDQRGHGKSDGPRGHVDDFLEYAEDLNAFALFVEKKHPAAKKILIGHSMGGQVVLNYLGRFLQNPFDALITSSANIRVGLPIHPLKKYVGLQLAKIFPRLHFPNAIDNRLISRDADVVKAYEMDPLVGKSASLKLLSELLKNQESLLGLAQNIKIPALFMHGAEDQICAPSGSQDFYERLASPDKALHMFDGMYHEIFNEFGKETVFQLMKKWIEKRI